MSIFDFVKSGEGDKEEELKRRFRKSYLAKFSLTAMATSVHTSSLVS
jgi:hypothetical protein